MMVRVEHVSVSHRGKALLDDVSLVVSPGRVLGLSGPNGSGKTMLMRVIAGLVRPSAGGAYVEGKKVGIAGAMPAEVGALLETPAFLDYYSGLKNLQLLASIRGKVDTARLRGELCAVGLDPDDKRPVRKYSLGMRQRLGIAAAIMESPKVVLFDEPANALDAQGVDMLRSVVKSLKRVGTAVVLTCHDKGLLEELSDEVVYLSEGRVVSPCREVTA